KVVCAALSPERPLIMSFRVLRRAAMAAFGLLVGVGPAYAAPEKPSPKETPPPPSAKKAVERALTFIEKDAAKWRADRQCATCHHGTMTVWALSEAKAQDYPVTAQTLANMTKWTRQRLKDIDHPPHPPPPFHIVNTPPPPPP